MAYSFVLKLSSFAGKSRILWYVSTALVACVVHAPSILVIAFFNIVIDSPTNLRLISWLPLFGSFVVFYSLYQLANLLHHLQQKEAIYLDSVGDGIFAINTQSKIIIWNKMAENISGWTKAEVLGKDFTKIVRFVHEVDKTPNTSFITEAMVQGKIKHMEGDTVLVTKDNREIPVKDSAAPIFTPNDSVIGVIVVFQDISRERAFEKAKDEFISLAIHHMKDPTAVVRGYTKMLLDGMSGVFDEHAKQSIEAIAQANQHIADLITTMLNVYRIDMGTLSVKPQPTNILKVAQDILEQLQERIRMKQIKLDVMLDTDLPAIDVDLKIMQFIYLALLTNAIKFSPVGSSIAFIIEDQKDKVLIEVRDAGFGIPLTQQSQVFTKFFRADNAKKSMAEGTGLGLYLLKGVVELSGGLVWFISSEGKGSTFFVTIPKTGMRSHIGLQDLS